MAEVTRTNGGAKVVVDVGTMRGDPTTEANSSNVVISFIGKPVQCFAINSNVSFSSNLGTGEAVEKILGVINGNATILAYGVSSASGSGVEGGLLSVIAEESWWSLDPASSPNFSTNHVAGSGNLQEQITSLSSLSNGYNFTGINVSSPGLRFVVGNVSLEN